MKPLRRLWWRDVRPLLIAIRWPLLAVLALIALILGWFGFDAYFESRGETASWLDKIYLSIGLFPLQSGAVTSPIPWSLEAARIFAPAVTFSAAILTILAIFHEHAARARVRWFARRHVVICGLGSIGDSLALGFRDQDDRVVAIEMDAANPRIVAAREAGVTVLIGDARDVLWLTRARVNRARHLLAVCDGDGDNASIAVAARHLAKHRSGTPLQVLVRVRDAAVSEFLETEMVGRPISGCRVELFNPANRSAVALLKEHPFFDEHGDTKFGPPDVVVIGLGDMGKRLVREAAGKWHATIGEDAGRFRVTIVDRAASALVEELSLQHARLDRVCELVPYPVDVESPRFDRGEFLLDTQGNCRVTGVYVCLESDVDSLTTALRVRRRLRKRPIPIVVRTTDEQGLGALIDAGGGTYEDLYVFNVRDVIGRPDVLLAGRTDMLARTIHEEYVRKRKAEGGDPADHSMRPWEELLEHLKESNRRQADDIGNKLKAAGCELEPSSDWEPDSFAFTPEEVERLSRMEHERWWRERESDGWTYAPEKDPAKKKSPYLVPYDQLSEKIKEYDRNAVRGIPLVVARAGFRVVRVM